MDQALAAFPPVRHVPGYRRERGARAGAVGVASSRRRVCVCVCVLGRCISSVGACLKHFLFKRRLKCYSLSPGEEGGGDSRWRDATRPGAR